MNTHAAAIPLPTPEGLKPEVSYSALLTRLCEMSVRKSHDPYLDVRWDAPEHRIEPGDPRLCLDSSHSLAQTQWYSALDPVTRARFGAEWMAQALKYAIGFEAVLSRGLLTLAPNLQNRTAEYRYIMHEVVEEGRHSMMFQELIDRLAADPQPLGPIDRFFDDRIAMTGRSFPELFFFAVLGGEIFIDQQNRELLKRPSTQVHPLVRRVMQIHVTEEARHVCFAEHYLREHLPKIGARKRATLRLLTPLLLSEPARLMLLPPKKLVKRFEIPSAALHEAFGPGTSHRRTIARTVEPVRELCEAHDLWWPRAWRTFGLTEQ
jgi:hypothetical protein